jgi:hypothetical protein
MTDLLLRFGLMIAVVTAAFLATSVAQRQAATSKRFDLPPGLVVVTGPECRWCDRLLNALAQRTGINYRVLEHSQAAARGIVVRSLPTALVIAEDGRVKMRRSGPSTLTSVDELLSQVGNAQVEGVSSRVGPSNS